MTNLRGYTLIETLVATGIIVIALTVVFLGFSEAQRINGRNHDTSIALNLLNTQIDADSKANYNAFSDVNPPLLDLTNLTGATITRSVTTDPNLPIKTATYTLSWNSSYGPNMITADYQLTPQGLNNE